MITAMPGKKKSSNRKVLLSELDWSALVAIVSRTDVHGLFLRQ
jgi:hypothetical protein